MRSTTFLIPALAMCLMAGSCLKPDVVASTEPLFCDLEEQRRFTQEELDWRKVHAPWNLRKDFKTNATGTRECAWFKTE